MAMSKKAVMIGFCGLLLGGEVAHAAIPVIDTENILQQIKTYTETVNVVTNTAQQISLQLKELATLPESVLNKYEDGLKSSISSVKNSMKTSKFFTESADWDQYWHSTFPRIASGDYAQTALSEQDVRTNMQEMMSLKNQQDVTAYHQLTAELDESTKRLQDLLEQNKNPEGNKQAIQIANAIAIEKAHIDSINTALQAISSQNQVMQNQAAVTEKQNHQAVIDAAKKAEGEAIEKMHKDLGSNAYGPAIDDPWTTYGKVRW